MLANIWSATLNAADSSAEDDEVVPELAPSVLAAVEHPARKRVAARALEMSAIVRSFIMIFLVQ
jgi:hypothetical protein